MPTTELMTVEQLIALLKECANQHAWVVIDGKGPLIEIIQENGANEAFIVIKELTHAHD